MTALFQLGDFTLASGTHSDWKIECDALTDDWAALAYLLVQRLPPFSFVDGVPRGGLKLADKMVKYANPPERGFPTLLVDDVFTTGGSMERYRAGRDVMGAVVFARAATPYWITPLFTMGGNTMEITESTATSYNIGLNLPVQGPSQPFCCPVCGGKGLVPQGFYITYPNYRTATTADMPETCRACGGMGLVWRPV